MVKTLALLCNLYSAVQWFGQAVRKAVGGTMGSNNRNTWPLLSGAHCLFGETEANQVSTRMKKKVVLWEDPDLAVVGNVCVQGGEGESRESFLEKLSFEGVACDVCSGASHRISAGDPCSRDPTQVTMLTAPYLSVQASHSQGNFD